MKSTDLDLVATGRGGREGREGGREGREGGRERGRGEGREGWRERVSVTLETSSTGH